MSSTEPPAIALVLYEDDQFAVVLKPAGMPAQADPTGDEDLLAHLAKRWPKRAAQLRPVHRLDRPVSGCMLVCWTQEVAAALAAQFAKGEVDKIYWAVVEGDPPAEAVLEHRIDRDGRRRRAIPVEKDGHLVRTHYRKLRQGHRYALLEVRPEGGVFHQIRSQLGAVGHPIKGDVKYGARRAERGAAARTIALHGRSIAFTDPATGQRIEVVAPPPGAGIWEVLGFPE